MTVSGNGSAFPFACSRLGGLYHCTAKKQNHPQTEQVIHKNFVAGFDTPRKDCASASAADSDFSRRYPAVCGEVVH